jgi:hypothetical protein
MSSLEQRTTTVSTDALLHQTLDGTETPIAHGELKRRLLFRQAVLVVAMVLTMTGWVSALGWVAIKLI